MRWVHGRRSVVRLRRVGAALGVLLLVHLLGSTSADAAHTAPVPTCLGMAATIVGTDGQDLVKGTRGDDVIVTLGGVDRVDAGGGDDLICGGALRDWLEGEGGDDTLRGGLGDDFLSGGAGIDDLTDRNGDNQFTDGASRLHEGGSIRGGDGDDSATLVAGSTAVHLGAGSDVFSTWESPLVARRIFLGAGNDYATMLSLRAPRVEVHMQSGDDVLTCRRNGCGHGSRFHGGSGTNEARILVRRPVTLALGPRGYVEVNTRAQLTDFTNAQTALADDRVVGSSGPNIIKTYGGDDTIDARAGQDTVDAGGRIDTCLRAEITTGCEVSSRPSP